jgi:hypothetical protein
VGGGIKKKLFYTFVNQYDSMVPDLIKSDLNWRDNGSK